MTFAVWTFVRIVSLLFSFFDSNSYLTPGFSKKRNSYLMPELKIGVQYRLHSKGSARQLW